MVASMDSLTIFGLFAVTAMLVFYALEERNSFYILWFAGACALGSIYGYSPRRLAVRNRRSHLGGRRRATLVVQEKTLAGRASSTPPGRTLTWLSASEELTHGGQPAGFGRLLPDKPSTTGR